MLATLAKISPQFLLAGRAELDLALTLLLGGLTGTVFSLALVSQGSAEAFSSLMIR